ncbi:Daple [Actinoplanes subtropicus]|uniref:Daple n=1 Tax=Actinoplanes subtropicus TaxID=543632 RepID=UPI000B33EC5C|nr:Daple [Actinoplanes subtropicus]
MQPTPAQPQPVQPASAPPVPAPAPPGFVDAQQSGEIPPSVEPAAQAASRWADARPRYSDLLAHLSPPGAEQARPPAPRTEPAPYSQTAPQPAPQPVPPHPRDLGETTGSIARPGRPTSLRSIEPISPYESPAPVSAYDPPTPNSAPPFPYEGDLEDTQPPPPQQRTAVPLVRPAAPAALRSDWAPPDPPPTPPAADEQPPAPPPYDPSFPRRVSYEPGPAAEPPGHQSRAAYAAYGSQPPAAGGPNGPVDPGPRISPPADPGRRASGLADPSPRVLPQRVPAQPDVPRVPEPPLTEPTAETPALARIATHLRRGDVQPRERQEGFDVQAILAAVRGVDGVRDASLRSTPSGAHSLRLDLAEGADPAEVSRRVARLLQERMGLDAAMKGDALMPPMAMPVAPPPPPPPAPVSPSAPVSSRPRSAPPAPAPAPMQAPAPIAQMSAPPAPPVEKPLERPVERSAERRFERPVEQPVEPPIERPAETLRPEPEEAEVVPADDHRPTRPLFPGEQPGPRIVIENVHVNTYGTDATVEVRLGVGGRSSSGTASGPSVDGYLLRLCATATTAAVDELLAGSDHPDGPARCFVEHAAAVPFGNSQVAVVVLLLSCNGWVEQLAGSAVVTGDDRHAMVRATLAAVNRRLEALLSR